MTKNTICENEISVMNNLDFESPDGWEEIPEGTYNANEKITL